MRRASTAVLVLLAFAPGAVPAAAASPLRGTVKRSYTATGENGHITATFKTTTSQVYASFIWLRAPTAGQKLEIDWFGPRGSRVAEWKNSTLATDTTGTRIYSFIRTTTISKRPGRWRVALLVGGVERGALRFTVAKP
ncbi:MAG: hypothetical protein ABI317_14310 [Gaiellales bacterium]